MTDWFIMMVLIFQYRKLAAIHSSIGVFPGVQMVLNFQYRKLAATYSSIGVFPGVQMVKNLPSMWKTQVGSLGWEDPLEKGMATTPVFLPGDLQGQRSLVGYSP